MVNILMLAVWFFKLISNAKCVMPVIEMSSPVYLTKFCVPYNTKTSAFPRLWSALTSKLVLGWEHGLFFPIFQMCVFSHSSRASCGYLPIPGWSIGKGWESFLTWQLCDVVLISLGREKTDAFPSRMPCSLPCGSFTLEKTCPQLLRI